MSFNNRYIEVDSTYRDRTNYPTPCDFVVQPGATRITAAEALDPIFLGVPTTSGRIWNSDILSSSVVPITATGTIGYSDPIIMGTGYYRGQYIDVYSQSGTYNSIAPIFDFQPNFDQTEAYVVAYPPLNINPSIGDYWYIRRQPPNETGTFPTGSTTNLLKLPPTTSSTAADFYDNKYIFITSQNPNIAGEYSKITNYTFTGGFGYAWIDPPFDVAPASGDTYDINNFSYDNASPLRGSNSSLSTNLADYNIRCLHVTIPGIYISNGTGGLITNYPYIHVELSPVTQSFSQPLYSNNPHTDKVLFKIYIDGTSYGDFIYLSDNNQTVTVKFNPMSPLHFRITLPDGTVPIFGGPDNMSPLIPIDKYQCSALFEITRSI
jgi:hypothetical protein